jgi:hypothetical protein
MKCSTNTDKENKTVNSISKSRKINTPLNSLKFLKISFSVEFIINIEKFKFINKNKICKN